MGRRQMIPEEKSEQKQKLCSAGSTEADRKKKKKRIERILGST